MKEFLQRISRVISWALLAGALSNVANGQGSTRPKNSYASNDCSPLAGLVLRCPRFGFVYKVPFGWVDRTEELQSASQEIHADAPPANTSQQKSQNPTSGSRSSGGKTLLAVFQRPPEAPGATINAAVVIAAEPTADYPKIKTAADYFGPLGEIAERRGLKMDGDPYSFAVGTKQIVRGEFTAGAEKGDSRQTSLVTIEKGYILSFTFVSSSDDEIEDLISGLSFGMGSTPKPFHTR